MSGDVLPHQLVPIQPWFYTMLNHYFTTFHLILTKQNDNNQFGDQILWL